MQLETFRGPDLRLVVAQVRHTLGADAMILHTRILERGGGKVVEVVAAQADAVEALGRRLDGGRAAAERARSRARVGPYVVALVGPPGAGKTTTAVKLALHPRGLSGRKVGFVTLDTHRVGAVEELQTYAEIADLPLEVVYHRREVKGVIQRMRDRDVIVVDTPGRPTSGGDGADWLGALEAFDPDEVHIVLPAGARLEVAKEYIARFRDTGVTHALYSKLDELEEDRGLAQIAQALDLPARWVADGYEIPAALAPAGPRILGSLGLKSDEIRPNLRVV
jgi:flagellar biosynthesis protein FlhF